MQSAHAASAVTAERDRETRKNIIRHTTYKYANKSIVNVTLLAFNRYTYDHTDGVLISDDRVVSLDDILKLVILHASM